MKPTTVSAPGRAASPESDLSTKLPTLSRRQALAGLASTASAIALTAGAATGAGKQEREDKMNAIPKTLIGEPVDPILDAIDAHEKAWQEWEAALRERSRFIEKNELPVEFDQGAEIEIEGFTASSHAEVDHIIDYLKIPSARAEAHALLEATVAEFDACGITAFNKRCEIAETAHRHALDTVSENVPRTLAGASALAAWLRQQTSPRRGMLLEDGLDAALDNLTTALAAFAKDANARSIHRQSRRELV